MQTVTASFRTPSITSRTMNCQSRAVASNERSCASDRSEIDWIRSIPRNRIDPIRYREARRAAVGPSAATRNAACRESGPTVSLCNPMMESPILIPPAQMNDVASGINAVELTQAERSTSEVAHAGVTSKGDEACLLLPQALPTKS